MCIPSDTTLHLESHCALINGFGSDDLERLYGVKPFNFIIKLFLLMC